jgi:hypothetical protein
MNIAFLLRSVAKRNGTERTITDKVNEEERKKMGFRARQAVTRYRKEIIMQEWEKAYLSVI